MTPNEFLKHHCIQEFFHFTDASNIPSIIKHRGLLSLENLVLQCVNNVIYASSDESRKADVKRGLDKYVRLSFVNNHPMAYVAQKENRLLKPIYLSIKPTVLTLPNIKIANGIAYGKTTTIYDFEEACKSLDFEILYTRTDWSDPIIQKRRRAAEKYELLIPNHVDISYIKFL